MIKKVSSLHQTLHGYNCGHHLLSSSIRLSDKSMRKMEKLSDLSGNKIEAGFEQYYTGYYLSDEQYYVIACTWYAPEMNRAGCVWTHSLLIKEDSIGDWINYISELLGLFKRPENKNSFISYENKIVIQHISEDDFSMKQEDLKYIMWALWGNKYPVIIPVDRANEYIKELLSILFCQYANIRKDFSFSTGALVIRQYERELLDLQMIKKLNVRVAVGDNKVSILQESKNIKEYPLWINALYEMFIKDNIKGVSEFRKEFPDKFYDSQYFSLFVKMYLALDVQYGKFKILDCLQIIDVLGDDKTVLAKALLNLYLKNYRTLKVDNVSLMRMSLSKEWIGLSDKIYSILVVNSLKEQMAETKKFIKEIAYIENNERIESILKFYADKVTLNIFEEFTSMDVDICCLFVTLNPKFALCASIWRQEKNFQKSILQCVKGHTIGVETIKAIVEIVIENSSTDLYYNLYSVLGEKSIPYLLEEACRRGIQYTQKQKSLKKVCFQKTEECFKILCKRVEENKLKDNLLFVELIDPHQLSLSKSEIDTMVKVFEGIKRSELYQEYESKIARFYIIMILRSEYKFPDNILTYSFAKVYSELANQQFSQDEWEKMEYLMPEFGYHNWDRCKRLKKSLRKKGYAKKEFKSDELESYLL